MTTPPTSSPATAPAVTVTGGADEATVAAITAVVNHVTAASAVPTSPEPPQRSAWLDAPGRR